MAWTDPVPRKHVGSVAYQPTGLRLSLGEIFAALRDWDTGEVRSDAR